MILRSRTYSDSCLDSLPILRIQKSYAPAISLQSIFLKEIKSLIQSGVDEAFLQELGLEAKFVVDLLDDKFESYEIFFEELFKEERHFAKRQNTWYNKEKNVVWLDAKDNIEEKAVKLITEFLAQ